MTTAAALILDVEGVIAYPDLARADAELGAVAPGLSWQRLQAARNLPGPYEDWVVYSVGKLDSGEYWRRALEAAGAQSDAATVDALREAMRSIWWGQLDDDVLRVADAARHAGLLVALLSNSAPEHETRCRELAARVDVAHFSHRTGRRKPDAIAYTAVATALEVDEASCIFVDDKIRNVNAAIAVGMAAFRFTNATALADHLSRSGLPLAVPVRSRSPGAEPASGTPAVER